MGEEGFSALRLVIYQPQAHYRVPFTYKRRHTYPLPSYSAVRGFLCNILGIRGYTFGENPEENEDFKKLKRVRMGICGRFEAKTTEYTWLRNLAKEEHLQTFGLLENRVRFGVGEHPGGQAPVSIDVLNEVRIVVYLWHEDREFLEYLKERIENPTGRLYPLYLGRAEDWVVVEEVGFVPLSCTSKDADFEHFFWVPEKPFFPSEVSFDFSQIEGLFYRVPFLWELRSGNRNFRYVLTKLNDGRFWNTEFLFDASYGRKGLPVFLAQLGGMTVVSEVWAKSNGLCLSQHLEDLYWVAEELENKLGQRSFWQDIQNLLHDAIFCHDLGKVQPAFQIVALNNRDYHPQYPLVEIPHSLASLFFIDWEKLRKKVGIEHIPLFLSVIAFHHFRENFLRYLWGKNVDLLSFCRLLLKDGTWQRALLENLTQSLSSCRGPKELLGINRKLAEAVVNGLSILDIVPLPYLLEGFPTRLGLSREKERFMILLGGFLKRCDHFASFCEEEGERFPPEDNGPTKEELWNCIVQALQKKIKNDNFWQGKYLNGRERGNLILIAPTGYGKTEFAFLFSGGEKLFYTLPLRSAVNQMYRRAENIWGENKVALLHADADLFFLDHGEEGNARAYALSRQLSLPVCVSTGDQFFPYALRPPGYERIYATFAYSCLVIDEVQAYEPHAAAIIVKFAEDVVKMGGRYLLMTATLPEFVKREIQRRTNLPDEAILNLYEEERKEFQCLVKHRLISLSETTVKSLVKRILDEAEQNGGQRVLVVLNTVRRAQEVYEALCKLLKDERKDSLLPKIWLFHSRFTLNDRREKEMLLEREFPNPKDSPDGPKILVATQVVEASLDIDADVLFTELAPLDALVQRMGRVLRRIGPQCTIQVSLEQPNVYLFLFQGKTKESGLSVYPSELLHATAWILSKIFEKGSLQDIDEVYQDLLSESSKILREIQWSKGSKNTRSPLTLSANPRCVCLSEYEKFKVVSLLYEAVEKAQCDYLATFYKTLSLLDAGYVSARKREAQEIFRQISDISVIPESRFGDFARDLVSFFQRHSPDHQKPTYTLFKGEILSRYVVTIPGYQKGNRSSAFFRLFQQNLRLSEGEKALLDRSLLQNWLQGVFVAPGSYDNEFGFRPEKEKQKDHHASGP